MEKKILENLEKIKDMSKENYEAMIVAFLIFENEGESHKPNNYTIDLYRAVYYEFISNDDFDLLNDHFEMVIDDEKAILQEEIFIEKQTKIDKSIKQER